MRTGPFAHASSVAVSVYAHKDSGFLRHWLLLICLCSLPAACLSNTVLANTQLQTCVASGATANTVLTCKKQLTTTLAVTNNGELATETLSYSIPCIQSTDGQCPCTCNYATDAGCTCRDLAQNINVTVTKTPVYATYPLTYQQAFNAKPYEAVVLTGASNTVKSCADGSLAASPTCGWAKDGSNNLMLNSQGFCCSCSLSQVGQSTVGSGQSAATRANLNCNFKLSWISGAPGSASCLRLDPVYYQGYAVGPSQMDFQISVSVTTASAGQKPTTQVLTLSPSTPTIVSANNTVSAKLLGDLAAYGTLPSFEYSYLMVPQNPGSTASQALTSNFDKWMMIQSSLVSLDGRTCNMVGTSYTAFQTQPNACSQPVNSCLANQLSDLATADDKRVAAGSTPQYYVSRWGGGRAGAKQVFSKQSNGPLWFGLPVNNIMNSVVTLNVRADSLTLTTNTAPGAVISAVLCSFNNASCGGFTALNQHGYLHAVIQNTGYIDASYTVEVTNCTTGFLPVLAQFHAIAAQQTQAVDFEIYASQEASQKTNVCSVQLLDSQGAVTDALQFGFAVNATVYSSTPTQSNLTGTGANANSAPGSSRTCRQICGRFKSFVCDVKYGCWDDFLWFIFIVVGCLSLVLMMYIGCMKGWWFKLLLSCCKAAHRRSNKARDKQRRPTTEEVEALHVDAPANNKPPRMSGLLRTIQDLQAKLGEKAGSIAGAFGSTAAGDKRNAEAPHTVSFAGAEESTSHQSLLPAVGGPQEKAGKRNFTVLPRQASELPASDREGNPSENTPLDTAISIAPKSALSKRQSSFAGSILGRVSRAASKLAPGSSTLWQATSTPSNPGVEQIQEDAELGTEASSGAVLRARSVSFADEAARQEIQLTSLQSEEPAIVPMPAQAHASEPASPSFAGLKQRAVSSAAQHSIASEASISRAMTDLQALMAQLGQSIQQQQQGMQAVQFSRPTAPAQAMPLTLWQSSKLPMQASTPTMAAPAELDISPGSGVAGMSYAPESSASSIASGIDVEAAAIELVEQAQMGEGAYLKLKSVVLQPPSPLVSPGPSACLAGWLDLPPSPPDGPLMVRFRLHADRAQQLVAWSSAASQYHPLPVPRPLDSKRLSISLAAAHALRLFKLETQGTCLN